MTKVLYPGSFDPMTKGHMNIVEQASDLFDEVIIAVMQNPLKKSGLFTLEERMEIIKELYQRMNNVRVISASGAAVDVALLNECKAIIRGLRSLNDYDYEVQLQQMNKVYLQIKNINLYHQVWLKKFLILIKIFQDM